MFGAAVIGVILMATPVPAPLAQAISCYEDLDYDCAEEKLAEALLLSLTKEHMILARKYDALLGVTWRMIPRVRRAVRAIYDIDPNYLPGDVPPDLARIFVEERPAAPPKPRLLFGVDYAYIGLADSESDAGWWQDGSGLSLSVGVQMLDTYQFNLDFSAVQHLPQPERSGLLGLTLYTGTLRGGFGRTWGRFSCFGGLGFGAAYVDPSIDEFYQQSGSDDANVPFWVGHLGAWVEVNVDMWKGLGLGVRLAPELLVRTYKEQPHLSYLLPLMVGVRYGR